MSEQFDFADTLNLYVARTAYTPGQLSTLSGLPKSTIVNWLQGRVARPQEWQSVVQLLDVLRVGEGEADRVLQAAGHPPVAELRRLAMDEERALLVAWPESVPHAQTPVPFQAIPDPPYFVGREDAVEQLARWLQAGETCVIQGLPGVGKTALAARLAYHLRPHFVDGVLWARLSASDPAVILATFARAYGLDLADLPDAGSRSRVVRDLLADKQALIVLDGVPESALVDPLLPPTGRCAVLITTRRQNLRVAVGARQFTLVPFSRQAGTARRLFARILGEERVATEAAYFERIAALLGHLPLALLIVASRLAYEPGWSTSGFLERLQQRHRRLEALAYEDLSFRLSVGAGLDGLSPGRRYFFATLSVFPGDDFAAEASAAVAATDQETAGETLRALHARSLIQADRSGRYSLHPLLRDFAGELLREEGEDAVTAARQRLVGYYRRFLQERGGRLDAPTMRAIATEQHNIVGALRLAWSLRERESYTAILLEFVPYLIQQGFLLFAAEQLQQAAMAGVRAAECTRWLATIARRRRHYEEAERYLRTANTLLLARESSEKVQAIAVALLTEEAIIAACRHDYSRSARLFAQAAPGARQNREPRLLLTLLKEWGAVQVAQGEYQAAEASYTEALDLARDYEPVKVPALLRALGGLAVAREGDYARAREIYLDALEEARAYEAYPGLPILLNNLAVTVANEGEPVEAKATLEEALALARQRSEGVPLAMILLNLGRLAYYGGEREAARHYLQEAETHAERAGHEALVAAAQAACAQVAERDSPKQIPSLTVIFD